MCSDLRHAAVRLLLVVALGGIVSALPLSPAAARLDAGAGSADRSVSLDDVLRGRRTPAPSRGVWPLLPRPEVVRPFDPPASRWGAGHRGADLAGYVGQRVRSSLAGRVSFVGRVAGRGVVVVDHGATRTTYEPVLATVSRGDRVAAGDGIGRLTGARSHCAPRACLHWGLRRGETYLDPLALVDAPRPVRLLPW